MNYLDEIRRQLPGLHIPESVAGAALGGGAGWLLDKIRGQPNPETEDQRKAQAHDKLKSILGGAAVGAFGSNLLSDRLRRWVSNSPGNVGYDAGAVWKSIKDKGWKGFMQGAVLDKPMFSTGDDNLMMRRELFRRGLGVHTETPEDFFKNVGKMRLSDNSLVPSVELNDRFFGDHGDLRMNPEVRKTLLGPDWKFEPGKHRLNSSVLGNFLRSEKPDTSSFFDVWDFSLHEQEKEKRNHLLKQWFSDPEKLNTPLRSYNDTLQTVKQNGTEKDVLTSLLLRDALGMLTPDAPAFSQTFQKRDGALFRQPIPDRVTQ